MFAVLVRTEADERAVPRCVKVCDRDEIAWYLQAACEEWVDAQELWVERLWC